MTAGIMFAASEVELRAGARVLRQLLAEDHPVIRRAVDQALYNLTRQDALRFTDHCEGALLAGNQPEDATPELLALARDVVEAIGHIGADAWSDAPHLLGAAQAAIAKAEGHEVASR